MKSALAAHTTLGSLGILNEDRVGQTGSVVKTQVRS